MRSIDENRYCDPQRRCYCLQIDEFKNILGTITVTQVF